MRRLRADFYQEGRTLDAQGSPDARCWICGQRIDYDARPSSTDQSHELDHFHTVADRPDLQEDPTNFRHAHRACNRKRGRGAPTRGLGQPITWW